MKTVVAIFACLTFAARSFAAGEESLTPEVSAEKAKQERYTWNIKTLVTAYETAGFKNRAWDEPAKRALTEFARDRSRVTQSNEPAAQIIGTNCDLARRAGCRDPMIAYLNTRFNMAQTNSKEAFCGVFSNAATQLEASSYPAMRKFYGWFRLGGQVSYTYGYGTNVPGAIQRLGIWHAVGTELQNALSDKSTPPEEVYEACNEYLGIWKGDKKQYAHLYDSMQGTLFSNWPNASSMWLLKGEVYINKAWGARGGGYANTVKAEGWEGFEENLKIADEALERAWQLNPKDPRIPTKMLTVELGQGRGRKRMEMWFRRAMELNPNNFDACEAKAFYLEPKWYGSMEDMFGFGWECAESTNWGGNVPRILADVHAAAARYLEKSEQTNYWKRPEVWPDLKEAYEKLLKLNPDDTGWYHNYARDAYRCERWGELNRVIPKLGPINYDFFGGKAEYDKMLRLAKAHEGETDRDTNAFNVEVYRLNTKIAARMNQGLTNEVDFKDLLSRCDALVAKHKPQDNEAAAEVLVAKAKLYWEVFGDAGKGKEAIVQLKQDFAQTELGKSADKILESMEKEEKAKRIRSALAEGAAFPEFDEKDMTGKRLSLAQEKGKVVLIDFWATWCVPCVAELPNVRKIYEEHHGEGLEIIGVSLDEERERVEDFIKKEKITWPQYFDGQGWTNKLAVKYAIESIPATFLLDGTGKIIGTDLRGKALEDAVREALKSK